MDRQYGIEHKLDVLNSRLNQFTDEIKYDLIPELRRIANSMEKLVNMLKPNFKDEDETKEIS